jgi:dephospho-CoA kinase
VLRVGLTGGVASGKSTVARLLGERGAAVTDADVLVEELYRPRAAGALAVAALFGARLLDPAGAVDRNALGSLVLNDAAARRRLEAAIHPLVRERIGAWLDALEAGDPAPEVAVVEAALLVESGAYRDYHRVVVASAPLAVRRQRALSAGWAIERFDQVAAAQVDDAAREAVADYVIRNDGDFAALAAAVDDLWPRLLAAATLEPRKS